MRDNLTGLYNTRYLYQELEALITSSATTAAVFSILFIAFFVILRAAMLTTPLQS